MKAVASGRKKQTALLSDSRDKFGFVPPDRGSAQAGLPVLPGERVFAQGYRQGALGGEDVYWQAAVPEGYADIQVAVVAAGDQVLGYGGFEDGAQSDAHLACAG